MEIKKENINSDCPLLSIVIANYNFGRFLNEAIQSVLCQCEDNEVELIVVDGGSTDNSVPIIKSYADRLAWWCSEKDNGQSHAFNKGFSHAKGRYLTWLNADDVMPKGALSIILSQLKKYPECEWFTGNHIRFLESDKTIIQVERGPHIYPKFLQFKNSPLVVFGPTTFFARTAYERVGKIDESLHLAMDSDLWVRFQAEGIKQRRINCYCWAFRMHEASKTAEFDGHRCADDNPRSKLVAEHMVTKTKVGYHTSRLLWYLILCLRLLDGSYIRRCLDRRRLMGTKFNVKILN